MFFDLFRKNKTINPIFTALGTDMHCHLVPMVDDGSKSVEESVACLKTLKNIGYSKVIITPHFQTPRFENNEEDIVNRYNVLKEKVKEHGVDIELYGIAGEYRIDMGFQKRLDNPRFLKIKDNLVLVEFPLHQQMLGADEMIFDLQMKGYEVVLAHPERYQYLSMDMKRIERLKEQGIYLQCNVLSLGGFYGEEARKYAYNMIGRGWVEFLGTDTHNTLYAQALEDLTHDKRVIKILEKHEFLNRTL